MGKRRCARVDREGVRAAGSGVDGVASGRRIVGLGRGPHRRRRRGVDVAPPRVLVIPRRGSLRRSAAAVAAGQRRDGGRRRATRRPCVRARPGVASGRAADLRAHVSLLLQLRQLRRTSPACTGDRRGAARRRWRAAGVRARRRHPPPVGPAVDGGDEGGQGRLGTRRSRQLVRGPVGGVTGAIMGPSAEPVGHGREHPLGGLLLAPTSCHPRALRRAVRGAHGRSVGPGPAEGERPDGGT